jgi:hypothetical protein
MNPENESPNEREHDGPPVHPPTPPQVGPDVHIFIDNREFTVHRGSITVAELKRIGSVPADYQLEQIVDGKLTLLSDDGRVTLKGGERFASHPRSGVAS